MKTLIVSFALASSLLLSVSEANALSTQNEMSKYVKKMVIVRKEYSNAENYHRQCKVNQRATLDGLIMVVKPTSKTAADKKAVANIEKNSSKIVNNYCNCVVYYSWNFYMENNDMAGVAKYLRTGKIKYMPAAAGNHYSKTVKICNKFNDKLLDFYMK